VNNKSIHTDHRKRLKSRFLLSGLDYLAPHEILELLLFYVIPRKNTNNLAHALIDHFGTIYNILDAPTSSLTQLDGVGTEVACFFKLIVNLIYLYLNDKNHARCNFRTRYDLCDHLMLKFIGRCEEANAIILLDAKGKIVFEGVICTGTHNSVELRVRLLIELITIHNAASIVFAHNHPSGIAIPSKQDIFTTRKLNSLLLSLNVSFIDHIIVADHDYVSLRDCNISGLFDRNPKS